MTGAAHWDNVYTTKAPDQTSWWQPEPVRSLALLRATGVATDAPIVDVGGGASMLADHLVRLGHKDISVLDLSKRALAAARERLDAAAIEWITGDVTMWRPGRTYAVWHDRATFHFLVNAEDRARYRLALERALAPGGHLILATFAPDGPETCSGLPVQRWSAEGLAAELGPGFLLREHHTETHTTPWGTTQRFLYTRFQRA